MSSLERSFQDLSFQRIRFLKYSQAWYEFDFYIVGKLKDRQAQNILLLGTFIGHRSCLGWLESSFQDLIREDNRDPTSHCLAPCLCDKEKWKEFVSKKCVKIPGGIYALKSSKSSQVIKVVYLYYHVSKFLNFRF